jgi:DNA-binding transcriptional LysR family regulator
VQIDIIKIEEVFQYLQLSKADIALMSHKYENPGMVFEPLARGKLVCIVSPRHPLAKVRTVSTKDLAAYPLIGIDPKDPYGSIITRLFEEYGVTYDIAVNVRFGTTVCALVKNDVGVAIIDAFTVADTLPSELCVIPLKEQTGFQVYVARRDDYSLSTVAKEFLAFASEEMKAAASKFSA